MIGIAKINRQILDSKYLKKIIDIILNLCKKKYPWKIQLIFILNYVRLGNKKSSYRGCRCSGIRATPATDSKILESRI